MGGCLFDDYEDTLHLLGLNAMHFSISWFLHRQTVLPNLIEQLYLSFYNPSLINTIHSVDYLLRKRSFISKYPRLCGDICCFEGELVNKS